MSETIVIAGFSLNKALVVYVGGFILTYILLRKQDQRLVTTLVNTVIIVFLFYRFGEFLYDPITYIKHPILFLQSIGSSRDLFTGVLASLFYIIVTNHKHPFNKKMLLDIFSIGFITVMFIKCTFLSEYGDKTSLPWGVSISDPTYKYHPINWYLWIITVLIIIVTWKVPWRIGEGKYFSYILFYWGLGSILISNLDNGTVTLLYLTTQQWLSALAMIFAFLVTLVNKKSSIEKEDVQ